MEMRALKPPLQIGWLLKPFKQNTNMVRRGGQMTILNGKQIMFYGQAMASEILQRIFLGLLDTTRWET